jgi:MFS family permease
METEQAGWRSPLHQSRRKQVLTTSPQVKIILIGQVLVVFAISLDMTILTTTLPVVAIALNTHATGAFWIASSYLLANAVVQPIMAALADIFGRRSVTFSALSIFTIGSVICCVANDLTTMLVGRTVQGIGGGGILAVNLIIISDLVPLRVRPKYLSIIQLVVSIGFIIAPIIGGALIKVANWR